MQKILIILFLLGTVFITKGQIICGIGSLQENSRPDTITTFIFSNKSLLATTIPGAKATSNFSFKTKDFDLAWVPVNTSNIQAFVDRSITGIKRKQIIDTLSCKVFGQNYKSLVIKSKGKILLFLFLDHVGQQDVFVASIKNKRRLKNAITFIETNLSSANR